MGGAVGGVGAAPSPRPPPARGGGGHSPDRPPNRPPDRRRVGILISGRGSNMAALIAAAREPGYPAEIVLVISNRPDAAGLALAREAGVPALAVDHRPFKGDREAHEAAIDAALREARVDIVCLAGYMRLLTPRLIDAWAGRM